LFKHNVFLTFYLRTRLYFKKNGLIRELFLFQIC